MKGKPGKPPKSTAPKSMRQAERQIGAQAMQQSGMAGGSSPLPMQPAIINQG